ncbi:MAG: cobalamin-dependent protein, partial [Nanoarchaeota archaeon]
MKVILINPSMKHIMKTCSNYIPMNAVNHFVPINLLYLGTVIKQKTTYEVKIIDADIDGKTYDEVAEEVKAENADIVGISAITFTFYDCLETIRAIKRLSPKVKICVGGPLVKYFSKETIEHPEIDYVLLGEAEYSFVKLVEAIEKRSDTKEIKGLLYKENEKVISTGAPETITNLDDLPFPSLELIDYKKYYFSMGNSQP